MVARMTARIAGPVHDAAISYNPVLDGLRAVAVIAVIGDHAGFHTRGFHGVTVFFVISGYLITALLIREHDRTATISLRRFYWRRLIRLGPALVVVLIASVGFLMLIRQSPATYWAGPVGALTYSSDLIQAISGNAAVGPTFQWSWSLGVEEQFYLLWPIGLLLLWRCNRALIAPLLFVLVASAWVLRALEGVMHASHESVFFGPASHYDALVLGVLVALFRARARIRRADSAVIALAAVIGGAGLFMLEFRLPTGLDAIDPDGFGQAAVFATGVVLWASGTPRGVGASALGSAPLAFVGRLSYGLYLWNILAVVVFVRLTRLHPAQTPLGFAWGGALLVVCTLSYFLVERPLRRRWASPAFLSATAPNGAVPGSALSAPDTTGAPLAPGRPVEC